MSFADELKQAHNKKLEEEESLRQAFLKEKEAAWQRYLDELYNGIKNQCMTYARADKNECVYHIRSFTEEIYRHLENDETYRAENLDWIELVGDRIYQIQKEYDDGRVTKRAMFSAADFELLRNDLNSRFEADELNVEWDVKEIPIYELQMKWVEHSSGMKFVALLLATHETDRIDGYYEKKQVRIGEGYNAKLTLSW